MNKNLAPTKLELFRYSPELKKHLKEITTGQIFDNQAQFHSEGLFSIEIFGRVGNTERSSNFAYIDLKVKVIHPTIFENLINLGSLYRKIMEGKEWVVFDEKEKDFVISTDAKAKTGFNYFIRHLELIEFKETQSSKRTEKIKLIKKAIEEKKIFTDMILVLPAGLRDYIVTPNGKPEEDEINTFYRKILARTSLIDPVRAKSSPQLYDDAAMGIQRAIQEMWLYVYSLINGKHKLFEGKWVSRKIFNSTVNVASSYVNKTKGNRDPRRFGYNDTRVGLYQFARSCSPLSLYHIKNKYIRDIFPEGADFAYLTNSKTLQREEVVIRGIQKDVDLWTTTEGLEKVVASLGNPDLLNNPIIFKNKHSRDNQSYYIGLLYSDDSCFKFFQDIRELPSGYDEKLVRPITLYEFIYLSLYHLSGKYPGLVTRYPITRHGSIYPSKVILVSTSESKTVRELDHNWELHETEDNQATFFPIYGSEFIGTVTVHPSHLGALGGDMTFVY